MEVDLENGVIVLLKFVKGFGIIENGKYNVWFVLL